MRRPSTRLADTRASAFIGLVLALSVISPAHADGPLGLYVGGTVGRGQEEANLAVIPYNNRLPFDIGHTAFGAVLGVRPMLHVGAEIGYIDFGQHAESLYNNAISGNLSLKADTAFAVFYLPLSDMELYGKVGVARLQSSANATENVSVAVCPPDSPCPSNATSPSVYARDQTGTNIAAGAGLQFKLASWGRRDSLAMRIEYERFTFAGANPYFVSVGANWTFL